SGTQADADASILTSKITVPGLPAWAVPRSRLERLIDGGVRGPLTALIGPPGVGKTLAMAAWAANQPQVPVAWVTLDEFDNRPRVLWGHVTAALRRAGVPVPHAAWAAAPDSMDHEFLVRLASALAAAEPPVILVLDDIHVLTGRTALQGLGRRPAAGGDLDARAPRPGAIRQGVRGRGQPGGRLPGGRSAERPPAADPGPAAEDKHPGQLRRGRRR